MDHCPVPHATRIQTFVQHGTIVYLEHLYDTEETSSLKWKNDKHEARTEMQATYDNPYSHYWLDAVNVRNKKSYIMYCKGTKQNFTLMNAMHHYTSRKDNQTAQNSQDSQCGGNSDG